MNTKNRVKQINLDLMIEMQKHNSAMMTGFMAAMIFIILGLTAFGAVCYRLEAIKTVVGL